MCVIALNVFVYLHFRLLNQKESDITIAILSTTQTTRVVPSTSAETEEMSSSLAIETPPDTDDDMSMCTNVSCCVRL